MSNFSRKDFLKSLPVFLYVPAFVSACSKNQNEIHNRLIPPGVDDSVMNLSKVYIRNQEDFDRVKNSTFAAGTMILFARNQIYKGQFAPKGKGTNEKPIIVTAFNPDTDEPYLENINDNEKPLIAAEGKYEAAFELMNGPFWLISNLQITNDSPSSKNADNLRGINIFAKDSGIIEGVRVRNNYIHDVNTGFAGKDKGGIFIQVKGSSVPTKFHDLAIEGNRIEDVGGIGVCNVSTWGKSYEENYYPWTEYAVRGNYIAYTGRNAIILRSSLNPVIEYNIISHSSRYDVGNSIFNFNTIGCVMQFNEVYGNVGSIYDADRGAFDADYYSTGTIIQYNYSHDNNWFASIMRQFNDDITIRYNISQNEYMGAYFYGFVDANSIRDVKIYNNTHFFGAGRGTQVFIDAGTPGRYPIYTKFMNNLFYFIDQGKWNVKPDMNNCVVQNNMFFNFNLEGLDGILADPKLINPGKGLTDIDMKSPVSLEGYKINADSPAISAGVGIDDNGGRDFFGNSLPSVTLTIGACSQE